MRATPRVLFVSYGGGHIGMVLPVMRELEDFAPSVDSQLLALTTGHYKAKSMRPGALGYRDFLHLVDANAARAWGEQLSESNTSPDVPKDETIAYLGINYLDLIAQYGEMGAADVYRKQGRYGFRPLNFMRRVIDALQPDAVVATNSPRSERTALDVATERGLPTVGMVDLFGLDSDTYVHHDPKPTWTCVISEGVRQRLIAKGFPNHGVVVTGNPAFDGLVAPENQAKAQAFLDRRGWLGKQVILYVGAWEPLAHPHTNVPAGRSFPIEVEGLLRKYVSHHPGLALIVRYHPSDWFKYPRQFDGDNVYFSEPPEDEIHPIVLASSVVVTVNSTVGLEAAVAGKSVISLENSPAVHHWFSLAEMGVSYPCRSQFELGDKLGEVLNHLRPVQTFHSDGRAARRVAHVVAEAIHAGKFRN